MSASFLARTSDKH